MGNFIKLTAGDTGGPRDGCSQAGEAPWTTPSIWINARNPGNVARPGVNNVISVIVDRQGGGIDPSAAVVEAWVCNPMTRPGPGGAPLASAGGNMGLSNAPPPTTASPGTIPLGVGYPQTVPFNWVPSASDVNINNGHVCIVANVYDTAGGDGTGLAGSTAFVDPCNNPHHGWHNIDIVAVASPKPGAGNGAGGARDLSFDFLVPGANLTLGTRQTIVRARVLPPEEALSSVIREELLRSSLIELLDAKPTEGGNVRDECLTEPRERTLLRGGGTLALAHSDGLALIRPAETPPERVGIQGPRGQLEEHPVQLEPGILTPMSIHTQAVDPKPGEVHEIDVVETLPDGTVIGGLRVVFVIGFDWWAACC